MADRETPAAKLIATESAQQRAEKIAVRERKAHAARGMEALKRRFGVDEEE